MQLRNDVQPPRPHGDTHDDGVAKLSSQDSNTALEGKFRWNNSITEEIKLQDIRVRHS